jgi:hypothetical protein
LREGGIQKLAGTSPMRWLVWLLVCLPAASCAQKMDVIIEYTTNGEVKLNILNITFRTTELHVTLLGCDHGYYDYFLLYPPPPSRKSDITPFNCRECQCQTFESERAESFYIV